MVFHPQQYRHQRLLELLVKTLQLRHGLDPGPQRLMKPQRNVRILRRVFGGPVDRDLVERELLCALAGNLIEGNRANSQISQCGRVHVVPDGHAVEDVRLEHGVVTHARELDAVIRKHMGIVFEVMAELWQLRVLEDRLQRGQHALTAQLIRRAGVVVPKRHVGRHTRGSAEGDSDDVGAHVVEARRLGVERE